MASADQSAETLRVDVIADLICPWCYIGKRRLGDALSAVRGPSSVNWIPFQLNPAMPAAGMALNDYLRERFGEPEALQPALAELARQGLDEGIRFRFDRIQRIPNTLDAHRLMWLAETSGADSSALAEQLLKAFFEDGMNIADREVLSEIGTRQGIRRSDTMSMLENDNSRQLVLSQEAQVRQSGVSGVPDFLVNRRLFVVGAQSTASLVNVFDRAMFGEESGLPVSDTLH
ncbi:MAG: DsbA family oxidoreductase [Gammaproteobacteria bacterium]|nr:DsbA family oxidoreductase [Gammaproteobacteria bacterium]